MPKLAATRAPLGRHLDLVVEEDLQAKMVFVAGPRQCGKTTLARLMLAKQGGSYFNWDVAAHRKQLEALALPHDSHLWVFDELHKFRRWRSWLKGVYDLHAGDHALLVTGSARLDIYSRGGDSLQGRYLLHRMHPVTLSELCELPVPDSLDGMLALANDLPSTKQLSTNLDALLRLSGFPEPLLAGSDRQAARFRLAYGTRLVREDLRDLESIRDLDRVELLFDRLPAGVGSLLSVNALREDLEASFEATETWLRALERLYAVFRVAPFGPPRIKAIKKSQKLYFWDWSRVEGEAARLENLVMLHLLRLVHWMADVYGEKAELRFFRDAAGHEVDAVVLRKGKPWLAVEVKTVDEPVDRGLRYLLDRQAIPWAFQLSGKGTRDTLDRSVGAKGVRLMPVAKFLAGLP